jgi:hypothetical protein
MKSKANKDRKRTSVKSTMQLGTSMTQHETTKLNSRPSTKPSTKTHLINNPHKQKTLQKNVFRLYMLIGAKLIIKAS